VNYKHAALFSYMWRYGVQRRGVGGRLVVLAPILSSWRVPYSNRGSFEGEGVVVVWGVFKRARGGR
jgi:hypothetical protein